MLIMVQEIGREKKNYYPFFDENSSDFNKSCAESIFGKFNLYNGVFLDANFVIMGSLHDYISVTDAGSLDNKVIRNASAFAEATTQKIIKDKVFVPSSVFREISFLEQKVEQGIADKKGQMKSLEAPYKDRLMSALHEYRVAFDNLLRKCKDKTLEIKDSSLYSVILEFINYLDGTIVHALENADKEVAAMAVYHALINRESQNTSVAVFSSDVHVRELVSLAYNCIVNYESISQPNKIRTAFRKKDQAGCVIDVIGYANGQEKLGILWDSIRNISIKSIFQKLSNGDAEDIARNINQRVGRLNELYCEIFYPEVKEQKGISLKQGDNVIDWLRARYFEARIPVELVDSNNELISSKIKYDMAALELCRKAGDTGEGSLEQFILKDVDVLKILVGEKIKSLEENRKGLADKALQLSQQVKDGALITSLGEDIPSIYKQIGSIDTSLTSLKTLKLGSYEAPKIENDQTYGVSQMSEEWSVDPDKIQAKISSMKNRGVIPKEGRKRGVYTSEEVNLIRISIFGKAISNVAKALGCAPATIKSRLANPELQGKWVAVGEITYIDDSAVDIIRRLI